MLVWNAHLRKALPDARAMPVQAGGDASACNLIMIAMSDLVWQAIIAGIVTLALAWMNLRLGKIAKTAESVHTLVNSAMGSQLKLNAVATQRLAILTGSPVDVEAANVAEKALKSHESKQATEDRVNTPLVRPSDLI